MNCPCNSKIIALQGCDGRLMLRFFSIKIDMVIGEFVLCAPEQEFLKISCPINSNANDKELIESVKNWVDTNLAGLFSAFESHLNCEPDSLEKLLDKMKTDLGIDPAED